MSALELLRELGHEELVVVRDVPSGLQAVIAIHDTTFGPAVGGTRMRPYPSLEDAAVEALRLARAMTYKAVMAEVDRGGGKGVIVGDPSRDKSRALLAAYARAVDRLGGRFHTGADMGLDARDVAVLSRLTRHARHAAPGMDTADLAALGVFASIRTTARRLGKDLDEVHVAVQGLGQVGSRLARSLAGAGARLTVSDVDAGRMERAVSELGAAPADPEGLLELDADILSPNAGGSVLNDATLPRLRCRAVVGAANDQLAEPRHGDLLHSRGILYAPDYVVNAGGLLSLLYETGEADEAGVRLRVKGIGDRLAALLARAEEERTPPHRLADRLVEERLESRRRSRLRGERSETPTPREAKP